MGVVVRGLDVIFEDKSAELPTSFRFQESRVTNGEEDW